MKKYLLIFCWMLSFCLCCSVFAQDENKAATNDPTIMWHILWHSDLGTVDGVKATFVQLNTSGKYYIGWFADKGGIEGLMYMNVTSNSFDGKTYYQSNGDQCSVSGIIKGSAVSGSYFCRTGDRGVVTGNIVIGEVLK